MIVATDAKELAHRMIDEMPDGVSLEAIVYKLYVRQRIDEGLRDIEAGRTISHEEMLREVAEWTMSAGRRQPSSTSD